MDINSLKTFWADKKKRNKYLLGILIAIWAITFLQMLNKIFWQSKDDGVVATMIVMMCPKCNAKENVPIETSTGSVRCKKCGTSMGLAYKCRDCQFEYSMTEPPPSVSPKATPDKLVEAQRITKCPNCGSFQTGPASP